MSAVVHVLLVVAGLWTLLCIAIGVLILVDGIKQHRRYRRRELAFPCSCKLCGRKWPDGATEGQMRYHFRYWHDRPVAVEDSKEWEDGRW